MKKVEKYSIIISIIALVITILLTIGTTIVTIILFNKQNELSRNLVDYQFEQDLKRDFAFIIIRLDRPDTNYTPSIDANNLRYSNINKAPKFFSIQVLNSGNMDTGGIQLFLKNEGLISNDEYRNNIPSRNFTTFDVKILEKEFGTYYGLGLVNLTFQVYCQNCYNTSRIWTIPVCIYRDSANICK